MSNFLQRVVATVIQPKVKLQPMLGSIFAPRTFYSPAEFSPIEISSQTLIPDGDEPATAPRFDTSSQFFTKNALETEDRWLRSTAHEDSSVSRPNRSPSAYQPLLPAFDSPRNLRTPAQSEALVEDSPLESLKPAADPAASPTSRQRLIAVSQSPPSRLQPLDSPSNPRRFQPAQREPDEIHIHIGRIEVAAIAEPAPRPAAAQARRSVNLDEYLRRSNGRPG
jgi:hypothetical protein